MDHCTEQNLPVPSVPLVFSKFGSCIIGPDDGIPIYGASPNSEVSHGGITANLDKDQVVTSKLDYEVELGIVIGNTVPRFTSASDAQKYIGGYTVIHDVSARDLQLEANGGQWLLGKCGDGYAPLGPVITTLDEFVTTTDKEDEFGGAGNLHIECRLTQKEDVTRTSLKVQSSSTSNLVFSTPKIIEYLSKFVTLRAGDVIATGTPPGVGCFRKPNPLWLSIGDEVECEIEGIGTLRNVVVGRIDDDDDDDDVAKESNQKNNTEPTTTTETTTKALIVKGPPSKTDGTPQKQRLEGSVCIVTGGARGLGYGIALRLALEGAATVVLVDMKQDELDEAAAALEKELQQMLKEATPSGSTFFGLACDMTDVDKVKNAFRFVAINLSTNNRIDILVQAAGVVGMTNRLTHEVDPTNFDFVMNVNVRGIFNGCHAVLPYMIEQDYGRIVNIASIAGKEGNAGMLAYSTSKAAVIGLTKTIGKEYATTGITCNAIAPAVIRTKMVAEMPPEQVKYMTDKIPMRRCGRVEEIASLVAFAASEESSFTTGFCWDATGGRSVY